MLTRLAFLSLQSVLCPSPAWALSSAELWSLPWFKLGNQLLVAVNFKAFVVFLLNSGLKLFEKSTAMMSKVSKHCCSTNHCIICFKNAAMFFSSSHSFQILVVPLSQQAETQPLSHIREQNTTFLHFSVVFLACDVKTKNDWNPAVLSHRKKHITEKPAAK